MAKETFSFEEAVAPAKVFSFEEALGEPAATNAPATEPEVVTSARPWQGAGAGRGGLNDPRRLDVERPNVTGSVLDGVNLGRPTVDYEANLDAMQKSASPGSVMFSPGRTKQAVDKQIELGELARRAGYESIPDYVRAQEDSERRQQFAEDNPNIGALASGLATVTKGTLNAIPAAAGFVNKTLVDPFLGIAGARMPDVPTAPGTSALDSMAKDFMPAVGKLKLADAWDGGVFKEWLAANVSAQVPQIAQSVYAVVNPAAAGAILPMMGAQAAGGSFAEGDDPRVAVSKGIVEMLSEGASFGVAEKVKTVLQGLPSAARQSVLRNVAQKALAVGGALTAQQLAGAVEESVAQLGGNALDIYASGKQKSMLDGVPEAAVIGAAVNTAMALPNVAEAARSNRPEDQAARELARELERGNLPPGTVETLNPNLSQPAITPKTLAGLTEIGAAASVDEAIIAAARATTPQAQAVDNIGRLLGDSANVSQPGNIPPVDSGAAGAGAPEPGIRVEAGVGASGAAGPALDARGVRDQPAGGAAPLATGRGAELTPDIAETTRQIQKLERAPESKPGQETRSEPASVWFGRRGDGYQTPEDAQSALPTRTRISPELDWRVEQMPTGRYRLAGYDTETRAPTFTVRMNPTGTATVLGNPKAIDAKPAEVVGQTDIFSAPSEEQVSTKTSEKTGNTTKTYGGYVDGDGVSAELIIVRRADGTLFRVFAKYGDGIRTEFDASYGPGITDEQIVKAVAEPNDWEKVAAKSMADQASEKSKGDRFPSVDAKPAEVVGQTIGGVKVQVEGEDAPRVVPKKAAKADAGTDTAPAAIKPVAPPANPPTQAQAGTLAEGAGVSRPAPAAAPEQVGPYGRDLTPIAQGGKPFKTLEEAKDFRKKNTNNMVVKKVGKNQYVLQDATPKQIAAWAKAGKRLGVPQTGGEGPQHAHGFLIGKGGLSKKLMADAGFDRNRRFGNRTLFADDGMTAERATELLVEAGYLREGASHNDMFNLVRKSVQTPQYTAEGWERIAEAEQATRFEDHLAAQQEAATDEDPFGPAPAFTPAEVMVVPKSAREEYAALMAAAEDAGIDTESVLEEAARIGENWTQEQYSEYVRQTLEDAIANSRREADRGESAVQGREDAERSGTESSSSNTGRPGAQEGVSRAAAESAATRTRPIRTINFPNPITGPSGAKLTAYTWQWKPMEFVDARGEDRVARISDWDNSETNAETGREVVHQFVVEQNGESKTVSAESAIRALGYGTAVEAGTAKSAISAAKTLARLQMQLSEVAQAVEAYEADKAEVDKLTPPEISGPDEKGWYQMGDTQVRQIESGVLRDERRRTLLDHWRSDQLAERGWKGGTIEGESLRRLQGELQDRIKRATKKLDAINRPILTAPTPAQVLEQQDRADRAEELDQREQIQREASGFQLQAQAPEQRRDNTGDVFGGPTAEDVARARDGRREADAVAQAARDAESGQGGLFASEPTTDYTGAYETDLFGEPLPAKRGNDRPARPVGAGVRGNAQPNQALRDTPRPEGDFYVNTIVGSEVTRKLGARLITSASDAATATSYLYKSAVERLDGIVTDQRGKPLAVIGGFKGANTQASVYPATLLGEAVRIPGAAYVWFSHNHPSGTPTLSSADLALNDNLTDAFRGSGIEPQGLLAVSGGGYGYVDAQGNVGIGGDILDPSESVEVPVVERQLGEGRPAESITAPAVAIDVAKSYYAKAKGSGIILLDAQLRVAGWVPISEPMTGELRGTGALNALYRALSQSNAVASIIVHGGELDGRLPGYSQTTILKNIAHAMMRMDVKTLDVINVKSSNPSLAHAGVWDGSNKGPMFSRAQPFYSALSKSIEGMTPKALPGAIWKDGIKGLINKGAVKEDEVEWSGIREWLDLQTGKVSKEDVLAYLDANGVQVQEVVLGGSKPEQEDMLTADDIRVEPEGDQGRWFIEAPTGSVTARAGTEEEAIAFGVRYFNSQIAERNRNAARDADNTKYSQYTLPGGQNYREVLLTLPGKTPIRYEISKAKSGDYILTERGSEKVLGNFGDDYMAASQEMGRLEDEVKKVGATKTDYKSSHWDTPNVLAHIRLNDRVDADGGRVLFVEEVQSDWGQEGKKNGFKSDSDIKPVTSKQMDAFIDKMLDKFIAKRVAEGADKASTERLGINMPFPDMAAELGMSDEYARMRAGRTMEASGEDANKPPLAPFVTATDKWLTLALKRVITMAAQEGYDKVAFVNGEQSAERYDLSKQVRSIAWTGRGNDTEKRVTITPNSGNDIEFRVLPDGTTASSSGGLAGNEFASKRLDEVVGKDVAERIMGTPYGDMRGNGLKVGGEGMKAFYDQIVPSATKTLLKKLGGGQMEAISLPSEKDVDLKKLGISEAEWRGMSANTRKLMLSETQTESSQPGFTITPAMREKASAGLPLFRRGNDQATGLTPDEALRVQEAFSANGLKKLVVVDSAKDLPSSGRRKIASEGIKGVRGMYDPATDTTYLVRSNLNSMGDAFFVGLHEGFHRGLRKTFGAEVRPILDLIHDGNERVRTMAARYMEKYKIGRTEAIEEVLADMAGQGQAGDLKGWDKLLAFLRDALGKIAKAMGVKVTFTDEQITDLVAGVRRAGMQDEVYIETAAPQTETKAFKDWFAGSGVNRSTIAKAEQAAIKAANAEMETVNQRAIDEEMRSIQINGNGADIEEIANNPKFWNAEDEELTPEGYAEYERQNLELAKERAGVGLIEDLSDLNGKDQTAQAEAFAAYADALGLSVRKSYSSGGSRYVEVGIGDADYKFRFADHFTTVRDTTMQPDFNVAPGRNDFTEAFDYLLSKLNESPAPTNDGAPEFSRSRRGAFDPKDPDIRFSRTNTAQTEGAEPVRPELSPWRDATGRLQFAPGAWLAAKYGDTGKGAIAGAVTGAMTAGPVGAVVGAAVGAGIGAKLSQLQLKAPTPELRRIMRQMKLDVAKAQEVAAAVAGEATKLTEDERAMVSDLIEKELKAGTIPPEHAVRLAAMINSSMEQQTNELVRLGMLTKDSADRWRGQYLPRYYESKLTEKAGDLWADAMRSITRRPSAMKGIKGKHLRGRGLYETIPESQLEDYKTMGWEVRDPDYQPGVTTDGTVQVWRDFTRQERDKMGEIRDAGFRFVMGYMQTQKDIALGKMFEQLAIDPEMSSRLETEKFSVRVPDGKAPGTEVKTYGKLAGRYVTPETLSQLSLIEESQSEALMMYRKAMGIWKEGKTVLNPVSHVNNTISNMSMAHFAGVSYGRADKYLAAMRDFAKKSPMILEAKDNGLFLGTLSEAELMNTLPEDLKALAQKQEGTAEKVGRTTFNLMTFYLRRPMGWAYQAEDTFFRYLIYKDARERGMEPQDAVDYAQRYIFTYDDLPKNARRIRDFGIPFFAYTYKAVPALLNTALTHPERLAAPAAVLWTINAAAYAIAAGDDEDDWDVKLRRYLTDPEYREKARAKEKLERELLPEWNKGTTSLMTPKVIRLGNDELTKLPMFIDVSRIIPGGDLFDVNPNAGGIGLPQPITPSHPLFTTAVAMLANKDLFFGKDLTDSNDTAGEKFDKRAAWMWKQLTPAITVNNYHFERGMNALAQAAGGEVKYVPDFLGGDATGIGRDGLPVQPKLAAMQTFGIKVRPYDLDAAESIQESAKQKLIRDIDTELRKLRRLENKGAVSDRTAEKERELANLKKDRLRDGKTVDGEDR